MRTSLVDLQAVERLLLLAGALRSGLIDALASSEGLSAGRIAGLAEADPRATGIVLEALVAGDLAERLSDGEGETLYRLTPSARAHLVDEGPELERFRLLHQVSKMRGWLELPEVIRTGRASERGGVKRDLRTMVSAMGERDTAILDEIVERCFGYAGAVRTMLDVGGAVGHLARHFYRKGVRASLFDRPEVLPVAREFLGAEADGIEMLGGDLTAGLPDGLFDLVYFGNVLHIYSPETNVRVVGEAFSLTAPGGTIAIQDYMSDRSPVAAMFAVNMLRSTDEGGVWSEAEHRRWLTEAGFGDVTVFDLDTNRTQLILARRPAGL
ncbi:MAG: methyltransferase domain-containing protein [Thermoleophilia bacterium]|nr:methyltransferase domain-containing protein [Thermoleophilia bacterium]